ncbi:oxygen-independent coproporphyrinogen III oxidase [Robertkochia sediminum]|uniref:oxygen-independent coproporphyrinogen III oxidase n=1 Tax=Robertkochia sediminum TaxID=2785326 RepID=UPI0019320596|nr:oxygen-independent coproporphyrinogen III oxidase [Robertkochia sediminum]MBL7471290.1 oxygen-independent coproporphyrinogen III oxidase [Robertkochia sediminum]
MSIRLIDKYNVPGPRYTSYPTVPYWDGSGFNEDLWKTLSKQTFKATNALEGISLYIHLPYCESMCTFCGCHKRITTRHDVESPYIEAVLKEWKLYVDLFGETPVIKEIHLGGGTPTFFSAKNLTRLIEGIFEHATRAEDYEFSFEGHPNNTTYEHLKALREVGFTRVSFGVQDYSPVVQKAINRIQPYNKVKKVTVLARDLGYESISHDLVFGLPFQHLGDIVDTINKTIPLMPDRIAFYSYAHVPWVKGNGQRGFDEADIPSGEMKRQLYETGKALLKELGYVEIGMDHFALPSDGMYKAMENNTLHRNFMGYTASKTSLMIGLGASSISDSWTAFAQNEKNIEKYMTKVDQGKIPVYRGHILNEEDLKIRKHILNLMCRMETSWKDENQYFDLLPETLLKLAPMEEDGLIAIGKDNLRITEAGRPFVRNVCMAFDLRLQRNNPDTKVFSMTI